MLVCIATSAIASTSLSMRRPTVPKPPIRSRLAPVSCTARWTPSVSFSTAARLSCNAVCMAATRSLAVRAFCRAMPALFSICDSAAEVC